MAREILWDGIENICLNQQNKHKTGPSSLYPRIVLGSMMVKHIMYLSDEETIQIIRGDLCNQYFLDFDSFS